MIDVGEIRDAIDATPVDADVAVSRTWLEQVLREVEAGRVAQARLGTIFGLQGETL